MFIKKMKKKLIRLKHILKNIICSGGTMNNYINFYYELYPDDIVKKGNHYYFVLNNEKYYFVTYDRDVNEADTLYKLNKEMISRNSLVHEIINNTLKHEKVKNALFSIVFVDEDTIRVKFESASFMPVSELKYLIY